MSDYLDTAAEDVPVDHSPPEVESRYHGYVGNRIPWYVRLIWLLFWIFAVYYVIVYLFPPCRRKSSTRRELRRNGPVLRLLRTAVFTSAGSRRRFSTSGRAPDYCCSDARFSASVAEAAGAGGPTRPTDLAVGPRGLLHDERHGLHHGALEPRPLRPARRSIPNWRTAAKRISLGPRCCFRRPCSSFSAGRSPPASSRR